MIKISPLSESALVCNLPPPACLANQRKLWAFADRLEGEPHIIETVVGMNNVTVFVEICENPTALSPRLEDIWRHISPAELKTRLIEIPVRYGGEFGEDLAAVAAYHKVSAGQIVKRHTQPLYTVYMIGFQAGFPYLGGLPESLHTPRRATPRTLVPAGSVGIGGSQTGIYPFASPGGWQLLGHTDIPLFDKRLSPPTLLRAGDSVRFVAEKIEL